MYEIRHYVTWAGKDIYQNWFLSLNDERAKARIGARIERLFHGSFGDCKPLQSGVWELRINYGPGYRVYYAMAGRTCVLLLCGGDKRQQSADIQRAIEYWKDYQERKHKS